MSLQSAKQIEFAIVGPCSSRYRPSRMSGTASVTASGQAIEHMRYYRTFLPQVLLAALRLRVSTNL
jgi:hypothetical protein